VWTDDDWPTAPAADLGAAQAMPTAHGMPTAVPAPDDDFAEPRWGQRWVFDNPSPDETSRARFGADGLILRAKGTAPADSSPLTTWSMDRAYEVEVEVETRAGALGGLLLYFNSRLFCGMAWDGQTMISYAGGARSHWLERVEPGRMLQLRLRNDHHIVTGWYRRPGASWVRHGVRYDTQGYHSATMNDLKSLRPAIFCAGDGHVTFRSFRYRPLDAGTSS